MGSRVWNNFKPFYPLLSASCHFWLGTGLMSIKVDLIWFDLTGTGSGGSEMSPTPSHPLFSASCHFLWCHLDPSFWVPAKSNKSRKKVLNQYELVWFASWHQLVVWFIIQLWTKPQKCGPCPSLLITLMWRSVVISKDIQTPPGGWSLLNFKNTSKTILWRIKVMFQERNCIKYLLSMLLKIWLDFSPLHYPLNLMS